MFNCVFYPSTPQALSQLTLQSVVQVALVFSASHFSSPSLPRHDRRHDQHFTFYSFSIVAVDGSSLDSTTDPGSSPVERYSVRPTTTPVIPTK